MSIASERKAASASTSDHQPMPTTATRSLRASAGPGFDSVMALLACCASMGGLCGPCAADAFAGPARDPGAGLPTTAAAPEPAVAFPLTVPRAPASQGG